MKRLIVSIHNFFFTTAATTDKEFAGWLTATITHAKTGNGLLYFFGINKDTACPEALGYSTEDTCDMLDESVLRCA